MKNVLIRFGFIFTIFLLFISVSISPSIIGNVENITNPSVDYFSINSNTGNFRLLAYWNFDEGNGKLAYDQSGNGFHGEITNASWTTGYSGYALNFNGESSNVNLDLHSTNLGLNKTDDYKISAWINSESTESGIIYMITFSSPIPIFYIKLNLDGTLQMKIQSTEICELIINSTDNYNDGLWHYIEGIYYGNKTNPTIELYVDNELVGRDSGWLCPMSSFLFKKAKIGMATNISEFFNGIIDEVKVFKTPNEPPEKPSITGPDRGKPGDYIEYKFNAVDPNDDEVKYIIEWGDNTTETTALNPSGVDVAVTHTWSEKDDYIIKVHAQDVNGLNGPEYTKTISMPKNRIITWNSLLIKVLERFPLFQKILNLNNN